jgi:hypothetical protein
MMWKEQLRPKLMKYPNICIEGPTKTVKTQLKIACK